MRAKQWGAMAGLDPRQHPPGSSVSKKVPLSKAGEPLLIGSLSICPLSAPLAMTPMSGPSTANLIGTRGLKELQAVCAVC